MLSWIETLRRIVNDQVSVRTAGAAELGLLGSMVRRYLLDTQPPAEIFEAQLLPRGAHLNMVGVVADKSDCSSVYD
jgi:hypothetical protein